MLTDKTMAQGGTFVFSENWFTWVSILWNWFFDWAMKLAAVVLALAAAVFTTRKVLVPTTSILVTYSSLSLSVSVVAARRIW